VKVVETIKELKADKNTCYISFDYEILKQIRAVDQKPFTIFRRK
jgi:glycerophosphoryl diester phosphodiesterase